MTDTSASKNSSLRRRKEAKAAATPSELNLAEEITGEGERSRRRRQPERRRSSRNSDIQETNVSTRGTRGPTSDSHHHAEVITAARRDDSSVTPAALQTPRPHVAASATGTSDISISTRHSKEHQADTPDSSKGSAVLTSSKNHAGSVSRVVKQAPHPHVETHSTEASDFPARNSLCKEHEADAPHPSKSSSEMMAGSKSHAGSVSPVVKQAPRPHVETPGTGASDFPARSSHCKEHEADAPHPSKSSAEMMAGSKSHAGSVSPVVKQTPRPLLKIPAKEASDFAARSSHCKEHKASASYCTEGSDVVTSTKNQAGSVSPVARQTPRPDTDASDTDTSGTHSGAKHDKGESSHSPRPVGGSAVVATSTGTSSSSISPHPGQTTQLNVDSSGTGPTCSLPGSCDGKVGTSDSALPVTGPPILTRPDVALPPAVQSPHPEDIYPSPGALKAYEEAQAHKLDHFTFSTSPNAESKQSAVFAWRKKFVRFGGETLREFIPLTTITDKITQSRVIYGGLGAIVALACVGLGIMLWATNPRRRQNECGSVECQNARAYLDHFLDKTANPCHDFYRHVCHRWIMENADGATMAEKAARDFTTSLKFALLERARRHTPTSEAETILVNVYDGCMQFVASTHDVHGQQLVIANQGDIDILRLTSTAAALRQVVLLSLLRGISSLFSVKVVMHGEGSLALYVSRGKRLVDKLAVASDNSTLIDYIREVLLLASKIEGRKNKSTIEAKIRDLLVFDSKTSSREGILPVTQTVNASVFAVFVQETNPQVWLQFINSLLRGNVTLNEHSPVRIHRRDLVRAAVDYLAKNLEIGLMYILLHILAEVGRFYYRGTFSNNGEVLCLTASQDVMGPSWRHLFSSLTRSFLPTRSHVKNIFHSLRRLSSQQLLEYGMGEMDKTHALAALKAITLIVDYDLTAPKPQMDSSVADHMNTADSFPLKYAFLTALEALRRLQHPPSLTEILIDESSFSAKTTYSRLLNAVLLPPAVRQHPLMHSTRVPREFDMGTIGVLLAKELFQAGLPSARSGKTWYKENVDRFVECVQRALMRNSNMSLQQGLELFSWARAVKIAHTATMLMYSSNKGEDDFEEISSAAQQTFFRRFCLMTCSSADGGLDSRIRCLVPLLSMIEFERAFECDASQGASLKHCAIFLGF